MGQEWAARSPFLFFTDFDTELGRKVTEGRWQEFSAFAAFADPRARESIPDPQASESFLRSRLEWSELAHPTHDGIRRLYSRLATVRLASGVLGGRSRRSYAVRALDEHTVAIDYQRGRLVVIARISGGPGELSYGLTRSASVCLTTEDVDVTDEHRPIVVESDDAFVRVRFERPGAVVFRSE